MKEFFKGDRRRNFHSSVCLSKNTGMRVQVGHSLFFFFSGGTSLSALGIAAPAHRGSEESDRGVQARPARVTGGRLRRHRVICKLGGRTVPSALGCLRCGVR